MGHITQLERDPAAEASATTEDLALHAAIRGARRGDPIALHDLYVRFSDPVFQQVRGIVGDSHDAEDITQAVFARLATALMSYERRRAPFSAWMRRVAHNAAMDHLRSRRALPVEEVESFRESHEQQRSELVDSLRVAFERLPIGQREVVLLRHVAGLSPGEIAQRLGRTESSVHALHHRGRARMTATLEELQATPNTGASRLAS